MKLSGEKPLPPREANVPMGVHPAVMVGVAELGTQDSGFFDKKGNPKYTNSFILYWQIPKFPVTFQDRSSGEERTEPALVKMFCTMTMGTKEKPSKLRKVYEAMTRTKIMAEGEYDPFDMIGKGCQLDIDHDVSDNGSVWEKVGNVIGLPEEIPVPALRGDVLRYQIRNADGTRNEPPLRFLSAKMIEQIRHSPEYTGLGGLGVEPMENVDEVPF